MKLFFTLFAILFICSSISSFASACTDDCTTIKTFAKRNDPTGQPIANAFANISQTITQLDVAQKSHGQNGTVNFNAATGLLAKLSVQAEYAENLLNAMGSQQLDQVSARSVKTSLYVSAKHVISITNLIEQGKDWFAKNNATSIVVQILQANVYIFESLFINLNKHSPPDRFPKYHLYESNVVCSMVFAIKDLDSTQVSNQDVENCYSGSTFPSQPVTPPGFASCQNSPATFYQSAYSQQTIGGSNTSCPSTTKVPTSSFTTPLNPCLLKASH